MLLDYSDCSTLTGWTKEESSGDGSVTNVSGEIEAVRTGGAGTSPVGAVRTAGISGATGHTIYWALRFTGNTIGFGQFLGLLNDAAAVSHSGSSGVYMDDVSGTQKFITWRGSSTVNSAVTAVDNTQYWARAVINSDGTITFSVSDTGITGPWTTLSSSVVAQSFDATSSTIHFITSIPWSAGPKAVFTEDFCYTDDGEIAPPAPSGLTAGTPTEDSIPLTWTDAAYNAVNCSGLEIYADDGSGEFLAGTAAAGDEAGEATGLDPGTEYDIVVRAYVTVHGEKFYSDDSNIETATTDSGDDPPAEASAMPLPIRARAMKKGGR